MSAIRSTSSSYVRALGVFGELVMGVGAYCSAGTPKGCRGPSDADQAASSARRSLRKQSPSTDGAARGGMRVPLDRVRIPRDALDPFRQSADVRALGSRLV